MSRGGADGRATIPKPERTPLPRMSLFIIFLFPLAEEITATVIYPFINKFVRDTGVTGGDERKTGYFAGVIVGQALVDPPLYPRIDSFKRNHCSSLLNPSLFTAGEGPRTDLGESLYYYLGHLACPS